MKNKDLVVIKKPAPESEFVTAFLVGMNKPGRVHKSQVGSKIPKQKVVTNEK